jgi:hypothetical protein
VDAEAEGFAQFVEARQRALQRTAWLLTGDWAAAEDLVQTALVRSWPRWERIPKPVKRGPRRLPQLPGRHPPSTVRTTRTTQPERPS